MNLNEKDKEFYRKMVTIGIPVVFQNLIGMGINLLDTLMIGKLGAEELAAVGAANQVYFIYTVTLFGLLSGAAVHTAQYFGAKDKKNIVRLLGITYSVSLVIGIIVSLLAFFFAPFLISLFSRNSEVIALGSDYMRIACISYTFSGLSEAISYNSRAIQKPLIPTMINFLALCINGILNYILIFGKLGAPAMGVKGAAIATLIARILEITILLIYIYGTKGHLFRAGPAQLFGFSRKMFGSVMKTAVPVIFTEGSWALATALTFAAYGMLGTASLAVVQVANVFAELLQTLFFGVGNSTAMVIGENLGKGDKEEAFRCGKRALIVTWILNILTTLVLILCSRLIAGFYDFGGEANRLLILTLCTMAALITPKMLAYMYDVGIFRAGGDTVFCMYLELACNIGLQVPLAFAAVLLLHADLPVCMAIVEIASLVRIGFSVPRFKKKKWINIVAKTEESI